jgi:hypothetical protein
MIVLTKRCSNVKRKFNIYTRSEADKKNIKYIYWKDCKIDKWAISDDDFVFKLIYRKTYTDKNSRTKTFYRFPFGDKWGSGKAILKYKPYATGEIDNHWLIKEARKTRTKNAVNTYVAMMMSKKSIDYTLLGNIYRPDQKIPEATVRRLFKQEKIKSMVEEKTKEVLAGKGITKDWVLQTIVDAVEIARNKSDAGNMLKAADNLADYLEMKPSRRIITDTLEIDVSKQIEDQIAMEEKRLLMTRKEVSIEPEA